VWGQGTTKGGGGASLCVGSGHKPNPKRFSGSKRSGDKEETLPPIHSGSRVKQARNGLQQRARVLERGGKGRA